MEEFEIPYSMYANKDVSKWKVLIGREINHKTLGTCEIMNIEVINNTIYFKILFHSNKSCNDKIKDYNIEGFDAFFSIKEVENIIEFKEYKSGKIKQLIFIKDSNRLAEEKRLEEEKKLEEIRKIERVKILEEEKRLEEKKRLEEEKRLVEEEKEEMVKQEYYILTKKYKTDISYESALREVLFSILIKMESDESINEEVVNWLQEEKIFGVLAIKSLHDYKVSGEIWELVKACSYFRKIDEPDRVIMLTDGIRTEDKEKMAALLTTRGGALKDIGLLKEGEICAKRAAAYTPKAYHPYNLLGSIFFIALDTELSLFYFDKALQLGSKQSYIDSQIRSVLLKLSPKESERIKLFLLKKDPIKFNWVQSQ